jgi:uncharacterized protein (UPF0216 family)
MRRDIFELELERLNLHLPKRRISLGEALRAERPCVVTRSGKIHTFDRRELEMLAGLLEGDEVERLMLPILIEINPALGRGAARIPGNLEARVAGKILKKREGETIIYRPEIAELRRKLPTTTCYVFLGGGR